MTEQNCLNLCEILPYLKKKRQNLKKIIMDACELAQYDSLERIYMGSSFCGKYFLEQSNQFIKEIKTCAEEIQVPITLVIPTFSQSDLEHGKKKISDILELCQDYVDELTVNDYGMLPYLKKEYQKPLNIGRLFMKDYRDPRYQEYFKMPWRPRIFTDYFKQILIQYEIKSCEFDLTHEINDFSQLPPEITLGIHVPFCYQTVGRICEYASISKEISKKYRANAPCEQNCTESLVKYAVSDGDMEYVRFGRTVYFRHPGYKIKGVEQYRLIYFPLDLQ